jgi:hypothetical protein
MLTRIQPKSTSKADKLRPENPFSIMIAAALKNAVKSEEPADKLKSNKNSKNLPPAQDSKKGTTNNNKTIRGPWTAAVLSGKVNLAAETENTTSASSAAKRQLDKKVKQNIRYLITTPKDTPKEGWVRGVVKKEIDPNQQHKNERLEAADINRDTFAKGISKTGSELTEAQLEQNRIQQVQARNSLDKQTAQNSGHSWASYVMKRRQIGHHRQNQ